MTGCSRERAWSFDDLYDAWSALGRGLGATRRGLERFCVSPSYWAHPVPALSHWAKTEWPGGSQEE